VENPHRVLPLSQGHVVSPPAHDARPSRRRSLRHARPVRARWPVSGMPRTTFVRERRSFVGDGLRVTRPRTAARVPSTNTAPRRSLNFNTKPREPPSDTQKTIERIPLTQTKLFVERTASVFFFFFFFFFYSF